MKFRNTIMSLGLAGLVLSGCNENSRVSKIYENRELFLNRPTNYSVVVDGKKFETKLNSDYGYKEVTYSYEDSKVILKQLGGMEVYTNDLKINNPEVINNAKEIGDKVLDAVIKQQEELIKKGEEKAKKDFSVQTEKQ